jgi:hypothetical protein
MGRLLWWQPRPSWRSWPRLRRQAPRSRSHACCSTSSTSSASAQESAPWRFQLWIPVRSRTQQGVHVMQLAAKLCNCCWPTCRKSASAPLAGFRCSPSQHWICHLQNVDQAGLSLTMSLLLDTQGRVLSWHVAFSAPDLPACLALVTVKHDVCRRNLFPWLRRRSSSLTTTVQRVGTRATQPMCQQQRTSSQKQFPSHRLWIKLVCTAAGKDPVYPPVTPLCRHMLQGQHLASCAPTTPTQQWTWPLARAMQSAWPLQMASSTCVLAPRGPQMQPAAP